MEEEAYKRPGDSSAPTLPLMGGRKKKKRGFNNVTKFTGEQLGGDEGRPSEVFVSTRCLWRSHKGAVDRGKWGEGVLLYKHPERERERERERELVRCGVAVRCSALWECVEVQWCCHGDKLRRSVLEVGVTECKSAYPTSTLIFTARATRPHLTRSRCLRATPTLSWQRGAGMQRKAFREAESGSGISSTGEEEGRI